MMSLTADLMLKMALTEYQYGLPAPCYNPKLAAFVPTCILLI